MIFAIETVVLCLLFFLICYLNTGSDLKNIKNINSYPYEVIEIVKRDPKLRDYIQPQNKLMSFATNLAIFTVVLFILVFFIKGESYLYNFLAALIMGEILNLFDLLVIDLLWWRNTKRIRFEATKNDKDLYKNPRKHVISFLSGTVMFIIAALLTAGLLIMF